MRGSSPEGQHIDSLIHRADLSLPLVGSQQPGEEKFKALVAIECKGYSGTQGQQWV